MRDSTFRALWHAILVLGIAAAAPAQTDFTTYVSLGDSLAAGVSSGALVETHQRNSMPALIARQAVAPSFEQPLILAPGIPPELTLLSLNPVTILPSLGLGVPVNLGLARPYNNLAVPGATAIDVLNTAADDGGMHDVVLRGFGTQVEQAIASRPTVITLWVGYADVVGAAIGGRAIDGVTLTPTDVFRIVYGGIVVALRATGAFIVAANVPDVTEIPFVTSIPPVVPDPATGQPLQVNGRTVPLLGHGGPLAADARVTLAASSLIAQGIGIPVSLGGQARVEGLQCLGCLPDEVILNPRELALIRDAVRVNNASIQSICDAASIPVVDINGLLLRAHDPGLNVGGVTLSSDFLTGGIFSYDGIHPTDLGYAILANEWISVINQNGGNLPLLNLGQFMGLSAQSHAGGFEFSPDAYEQLLRLFPRLDE
jgi:hypothetical protein